MNSEVLVIGGGVIGLAVARELHKKGVRQITIVERGEIGGEASYAAAGMLAPNVEALPTDDFYRLCAESLGLYPEFAVELYDETGIDIELDRSGTLYLAFTDEDVDEMRPRFERQVKAGLPIEHLTAEETRRVEPFVSPEVRESLFFKNDWQIENRKLLAALRKYAESNGMEICEGVKIDHLTTEAGRVTGAAGATASFFAGKTLLATGAWTSFIKLGDATLPVNIKPIRGQMISFHTAKRLFQRVLYTSRGYIVPRTDGKILVGATVEDVGFDKNVSDSGVEFLRETALEISPSLGNLGIVDKWAGLRPMSADALPVLGQIVSFRDLLVATAHFRNGILLAPLTGKLMAGKLAENADSDYFRTFGPGRFGPIGMGHPL